MGYAPASAWEDRTGPAERFLADYRSKTELNRRILNHLLHDAFRGDDGRGRRPDRRPGARPRAERRVHRGGAGAVPVPRPRDGLPQPDGPGPRGLPVPVAGPLPPLPGRDRPAAARGGRPHARPGHDADQPREGLGLARGQGDPLGAVQLQPAQPAALRRALRDQPVPLRDPDQQPGDDRRPDRFAGRRSARCRARRSRPSWPSSARGPRTWRRSSGASGTRSGCGSAPATSSAASRSAR